jgi:cobalt-zinc-cadmium efflux system membrane fusion protein
VGEKEYLSIREGERAILKVASYPEEEFYGEVKEVSPFFDPRTHSALVEVEILNQEGKLKPGMFGELKIEVAKKDNVLVQPFDSILKDEKGEYVYLVEGNLAKKRYIQTGLRAQSYLEVTAGIEENALVVRTGEEFLKDNSLVKVILE